MLQGTAIADNNLFIPRSPSVISTDVESAMATIMLAFSSDPAARWVYPDAADHARYFPAFVRALAGDSFSSGTAFVTQDAAGAALWLRPGVSPDEESLARLFESSTSDDIQRDIFSVLEGMRAFRPAKPHWYLTIMGVDPARQGRGTGSALLVYGLSECDAEGLPAYLVSSNPNNVSFYERFGFEQIGTIRHGNSAPLFPMLRKPR